MRVYLDVAFAVNGIVDYLLLVCTTRLSGYPGRRWRMALAAALGGLFAVVGFIWPFWQSPAMRLVMLVGMLLTAFGTGREVVRQGALFVLTALALAGLVYLVALLFDWGLVILNQTAYYPVSAPALLMTAGLGYLLFQLALRRCAQHGSAELAAVVIRTEEGQVRLTALRDTGNTLRDPMSNTPVLIVDWRAVASLLPGLEAAMPAQPLQYFTVLAQRQPALHWRLLPYRVVGGKGFLLAFRPTAVLVEEKPQRLTVALSPTPVSDGGSYKGLLGGER